MGVIDWFRKEKPKQPSLEEPAGESYSRLLNRLQGIQNHVKVEGVIRFSPVGLRYVILFLDSRIKKREINAWNGYRVLGDLQIPVFEEELKNAKKQIQVDLTFPFYQYIKQKCYSLSEEEIVFMDLKSHMQRYDECYDQVLREYA
jgi:hypothetical protein